MSNHGKIAHTFQRVFIDIGIDEYTYEKRLIEDENTETIVNLCFWMSLLSSIVVVDRMFLHTAWHDVDIDMSVAHAISNIQMAIK